MKIRLSDPLQLRSTYLDISLADVLREVADDDLALAGGGRRHHRGRRAGAVVRAGLLLDATGGCGDRGFGLGGSAASRAAEATATSSGARRQACCPT